MRLRNVSRIPVNIDGASGWLLQDLDGQVISSFTAFSKKISGESFATRKRYCEVVSRFIDYLYEVKILGAAPVTRAQVNEAIDFYLMLLRDGDQIFLGRTVGSKTVHDDGEERRENALREVARKLGIRRLAPNSWSNTIAPLNAFFRICSMLEQEAHEIAVLRGGVDPAVVHIAQTDPRPLIAAVAGSQTLAPQEIQSIKMASALGAVIRFRGEDIKRPRGIKAPKFHSAQRDTEALDFPMQHFPALLDAAGSLRDKTLWLLTAASGIRRSEALNLEWHQIDFDKQLVYVLDPDYRRYGRQTSDLERTQRFKGRSVSWTYLRLPYRQIFFESLLEYRKQEYVLPRDGNDYVFQFLNAPHRGRPYREASDAALNEAFKAAVRRAKIPGPPMAPEYVWTQHSLRHAYGVYMFNDLVVPGKETPGLTEAEVQMLMGHRNIDATRRYARLKEESLLTQLARHDQMILGAAPGFPNGLENNQVAPRLTLNQLLLGELPNGQ